MKRYIRLLFIFAASTLFSGCHFLEVTPVGKTTIPLFFSDMDGIRAAVPGVYTAMFTYYNGEFYKYPDVAGNMLNAPSTGIGAMADQFNFTSTKMQETGAVGIIWTKAYYAMANINNVLTYLPSLAEKFPNNKRELDLDRAEMLFLRALCHFDLCRVYAQPYNYTTDASHLGVPVLLSTPGAEDNPSRESVKKVYEQILEDLEESISLFGNTAKVDSYHASSDASTALMCRVFLYMGNWDYTISTATSLINRLTLTSRDNYLEMFNKQVPGEEMIFRFNGTEHGKGLSSFYDPLSPSYVPADTLLSLFSDIRDIRRGLLYRTDVTGVSTPRIYKYYITVGATDTEKHNDPIVLRLSEVYLNRAEAYLRKNDITSAGKDLQKIIGRALGIDPEDVAVPSDYNEMLKLIEQERAKELFAEGHQFFDIARWNKALERDKNTLSTVRYMAYPDYKFVLPISNYELEANTNMQPNPGY